MSLLSLDNVHFKYDRIAVLSDISCQINPGEAWYIKGCNGSGKSTLLKIMAGLLEPKEGSRDWNDTDVVSYYNPEVGLYQDLSVLQNIEFFSQISCGAGELAKQAYDLLGIEPLLKVKFRALSHGQKFRVQLYRALSLKSRLYLLDEPFEGLDAQNTQNLLYILKSISKLNLSWIIVSHYLEDELGQLCSHQAYLEESSLYLEKHP